MGRRVSRRSKKVIFGGDRGKNVPFKCGQIALEKGRNSTYDYKWRRSPHAAPRGPAATPFACVRASPRWLAAAPPVSIQETRAT